LRHSNTESVFGIARNRIVEELGNDDADGIAERVQDAWTEIGGTGGPMRSELVEAFAEGTKKLKAELSSVSRRISEKCA
jgi:hypothetical protein